MRHGQDLGWRITLNGVTISGGDFPGVACLTLPPEGLGLPELRTEDVTFPQRDGVRHFADWYEPRIITLEATVGAGSCCRGCGEERARVREILKAWSRECDDTELVVHPPCPPHPLDRTLTGPYGVVGRPRVAEVTWRRGKRGIADLVLRFDGVDHRMYILDEDGTPGSGDQCVTLTPDSEGLARCYDRCYTTGRTPGEPDTLTRTNDHPNPFVGFEAADVWSDTFDTDISGWSGYISTPAGTWAAPGVLRMGSSGDVINWAVTNGDYLPGGKFIVTGRMRVVSSDAEGAVGPHVSFNFGGTQVTAHVTGWDHPVGEWGDFTTTGTVPASFNPETQTGNLRLGMRFAGSGQSVVEVDSVAVEQTTGTGWTLGGRDGVTQTVETESGPTFDGREVPWLGLSFDDGSGTPVVYTNGDGTPRFPVTSDEEVVVSAQVLVSSVTTQLGLQTDNGTVWGEEFFPGEGWTQITDTLTVPTDATEGRLLVRFAEDDIQPGILLGVTGATVGVSGEPFDGDTPDNGQHRYVWTGDPYQSASQEWELGGRGEGGTYCYDTEIGDSDGGPTPVTVIGDTCVSPTITLHGPLTYPTVQNLTTGETIRYRDVITDSDSPVIIDTADGTATQGGASRTHLLDGNVRMVLDEGENLLRLISFQSSDNGYAEICFRPIVIGA